MPQPTSPSTAYVPALDGVRALAVLAVLGYHAAVPGLEGGLLGVGVFLTLSGFLITSILLSGWERRGSFDLRTFWVHRARRLLPALGVLLASVLAVTAVVDPGALSRRWDETLAAALYVSNWIAIADRLSYAAVLGGPEPLEHLWSLAVEEQFYLVWPILLLVLLRWFRGDRGAAALATGVLALASFVWMAVLASPGLDNTRAYEGTDTRAGELLVGAALALLLGPLGRRRRPGVPGRVGLDAGGLLALGVLVWLVVSTDFWSIGLYRGGFLLLALATAVLLAAVTTPGSVLGALLGIRPLRWVGERSYGIYLWHMPVIAFSPPAQAGGPAGVHTAYYLLATFALASFSWAVVEDPVRRHGLVGALRRLQPQPVLRGRLAPPVLVGGLAVVLGGSAVMATSAAVSGDRGGPGGTADGSLVLAAPVPDGEDAAAGAGLGRAGTARTSCTSVVHVGDSTSLGLVRPAYTPRRRDRIPAQYRRVGVEDVRTDVSGARSIVEHYQDQPNAEEAVRSVLATGYDGCWVLAMGTNDTANRFVGGAYSLDQRIDRLMGAVDGQPVLWPTLRTLRTSGPWAEEQMQEWNAALRRATRRYPNLRLYDWAEQVRPGWFIADGIHFTVTGYRERSRRIADALAVAFPAGGEPSNKVVVTP